MPDDASFACQRWLGTRALTLKVEIQSSTNQAEKLAWFSSSFSSLSAILEIGSDDALNGSWRARVARVLTAGLGEEKHAVKAT